MTDTLIMKFGGSGLLDSSAFLHIAQIIKKRSEDFSRIVVVVSALKGMTDHLLALARDVHPFPPQREQDMLISVGERISSALLAMALAKIDISAISLTGSQSGIITTNQHQDAKIIDVKPARILETLDKKNIVIVAGFQGVSKDREITTLGRGGSDITAVALAAALGGDQVEFYKDVGAVFSGDPKKEKNIKRYGYLTYQKALDIVRRYPQILHPRAIALAQRNQVLLHIRSFSDAEKEGTIIGKILCKKDREPLYET